jgi:hypothetical protein
MVTIIHFCVLRRPLRPGVGNRFRTWDTLRLNLYLAGRILEKNANFKLPYILEYKLRNLGQI